MELPIEHDPNFGGGEEEDLSPEWLEAARVNANDDPALRAGRLKKFRESLDDHKIHLRPGDDRQLLGLLRSAKCDIPKAVEVTEAFVDFLSYFEDATPSKMLSLLEYFSKCYQVLPHRDKYGRRQILYKMWDADKYPFMRTTKSSFLTYMTLAREPKTQIAGITLLGDMEDMTRKHGPGNWAEVKMYASFMRGGIPVFFHKHHIVGGPWIFEYLYRMGKPLLSDAVYNSTIMYKKTDESYRKLHSEHFDKGHITAEFGGDLGPMDNTVFVEKQLKLDGYFEEVLKSYREK